MKFHRFPILVQKQIMEDFSYEDLFCLSLTSTRTARLIRCLKFAKVSKVIYGQTPRGFDVSIKDHQDSKLFPVGSVEIKRSRNFSYLFTTQLGGSKMDFECRKNEEITICCQFKYLLFCRDDHEKSIPKSMIKHAGDLFGQPPIVSLCVNFDATLDVIPVAPSVTELEFVSNRKINAKGLQFIKNHPNLKYLFILGQWTVEPDLCDIPYLEIQYSDHWANSILRSFKGTNLKLNNAKIGKEEILDFIRTWMNNDGYHNVECIQIDLKEEIHVAEDVTREVENSFWDPNQRPAIYEYCNPSYHKRQVATFMCHNIRRNGDNQLASFYICTDMFTFVVWK